MEDGNRLLRLLPLLALLAGYIVSLPFVFNFIISPLYWEDFPMHAALIDFQALHFWPSYSGWNSAFFPGFPQGTFYPPLPHWIAAALTLIGLPSALILKLMALFSFAATPLCFFYLSKKCGLDGAMQAMSISLYWLAMLTLNYDFINWSLWGTFVTGTISQTMAYPLLLLYFASWADVEKNGGSAGWHFQRELLLVLLLLTNAFSATAVLIWHVAYGAYNFFKGRRQLLKYCVMHIALGFSISAFFWLPFAYFLPFSFGYRFSDLQGLASGVSAAFLLPLFVLFSLPIWAWFAVTMMFGNFFSGQKRIIWLAVLSWLLFIAINNWFPVEESRLFGFALLFSFLVVGNPSDLVRSIKSELKTGKSHAKQIAFIVVFFAVLASAPGWLRIVAGPPGTLTGVSAYGYRQFPVWDSSRNIPSSPPNNTFWLWEYNYPWEQNDSRLDAPVYFLYSYLSADLWQVSSAPMLFIQSSPNHAALDLVSYSFSNRTFYGAVSDDPGFKLTLARSLEILQKEGARTIAGSPQLLAGFKNCTISQGSMPEYVICTLPQEKTIKTSNVTKNLGAYSRALFLWMKEDSNIELVWQGDGIQCDSGWRQTGISYFPKWAAYSVSGEKLPTAMSFPYMLSVCGAGVLKYEISPIEYAGYVISAMGLLVFYAIFTPTQKRWSLS